MRSRYASEQRVFVLFPFTPVEAVRRTKCRSYLASLYLKHHGSEPTARQLEAIRENVYEVIKNKLRPKDLRTIC